MAYLREDRLLMIDTTVRRLKFLLNWCNDDEKEILRKRLEEVLNDAH